MPGFDTAQFQMDRRDPALREQVQYELALGKALGVRGTPGICVNGKCVSGWGSYNMVENDVKRAMERMAKFPPADPSSHEPLWQRDMRTSGLPGAKEYYDLLVLGIEHSEVIQEV